MTTKKLKRRPKLAQPPTPDHRAILARRLDMIADFELQQGHVATAEMLAHRAAMLREAAR